MNMTSGRNSRYQCSSSQYAVPGNTPFLILYATAELTHTEPMSDFALKSLVSFPIVNHSLFMYHAYHIRSL